MNCWTTTLTTEYLVVLFIIKRHSLCLMYTRLELLIFRSPVNIFLQCTRYSKGSRSYLLETWKAFQTTSLLDWTSCIIEFYPSPLGLQLQRLKVSMLTSVCMHSLHITCQTWLLLCTMCIYCYLGIGAPRLSCSPAISLNSIDLLQTELG
jgi:hypothetical protein